MRFLSPAELRGLDTRALEELLERRDSLVAAGEGLVSGVAAAALLFADYAVMRKGGSIVIDGPEAWAGVVWRLGHAALRIEIEGATSFGDADARAAGLIDETYDGDPAEWLVDWMRGRSADALDAAAVLIRLRGGDALERVTFASLFASGEPQKGLAAFLEKRKPRF